MGNSVRSLPSRTWNRIILRHSAFPTLAMLILWVNYVFCAVFKYDLIARASGTKQDTGSDTTVYLILAIIATVVAPPFAYSQVNKALLLAQNGLQ